MNSVELKHFSKKIKKNTILNDINVQFEKEKIHGISGRNGSGKTMLLRAIAGLIRPTIGEVKIFGKTLHKDISFPDSIGIIIEYPGLLLNHTGFQNLKILASIKNIITDEEIKHAIARVGLDPNDDRKVKEYSLGMKQRLGIAQAIMEKPELILLDEPTNALDDKGIKLVKEILIEEKKHGATILIASHNKYDLDELSDIQYKIDNGKIYYSGDSDEKE